MTKEALKLALAYVQQSGFQVGINEIVTAIKEALAQPEQKPVYKYCDDGKVIFTNPEILSRRPNKEKTHD